MMSAGLLQLQLVPTLSRPIAELSESPLAY